MKKVLIPTKLDKVAKETLLKNGNYEVIQDASGDIAEIAKKHPDSHALIVRSEKVTPAIIDSLPNLKVIVRAGAGFNTIDTKYARKKGIDVMNTPGANSNAVAEEAIALMLADARHVIKADTSTRDGKWEKNKFMGRELAGKTVGIIGLGNIGQILARRLSGFDVKLLGYDPVMSTERAADINVALTDLKTLFAESDYITLHIPENSETKGMINAGLLNLAKPGATIVNCARSGVIDENALREAKQKKSLRFLNDVYTKDAEGPKSVADIADIMLPHLGANTVEANFKAAKRSAEELIELDEQGVTSFIVNRDIPEGLDREFCSLANTLARLSRRLLGSDISIGQIETSFYGSLEPYAKWLIVPIVAGISDEFDSSDYGTAMKFLEEMGVKYINRKTDARKGYENSITVDLIGSLTPGNLKSVSIRGTVAEGIQMISRINEFNKLYFDPKGHNLFFIYDDRPGVTGTIGAKLAEAGINIEDMRNPHDFHTNKSLAILKVNKKPENAVIDSISSAIGANTAFCLEL